MDKRTSQQLDGARQSFSARDNVDVVVPCLVHAVSQNTHPHTIWTEAFAEHHDLVGVDELLYPSLELVLLGVFFYWRHFVSVCLRGASFRRRFPKTLTCEVTKRVHLQTNSKLMWRSRSPVCRQHLTIDLTRTDVSALSAAGHRRWHPSKSRE